MDLEKQKWEIMKKSIQVRDRNASHSIKANEQYVFLLSVSRSEIAWNIFDFRDNNNHENHTMFYDCHSLDFNIALLVGGA